jgi:PPP family 3-phenylpropionic acid transporter
MPTANDNDAAAGRGGLAGFLTLYAALYGAYGTESAYLPAFLQSHGLAVERVGLVLAAGTLVRVAAGPAIGRLADALGRRKAALTLAAVLSGLTGWAYLVAFGFWPLLGVSLAAAAATASLAPLSDALAVGAAAEGRNFQYGWVRGAGSAAFVAGTLASGQLIDRVGLASIIVASSLLFLATGVCSARVAACEQPKASEPIAGGFAVLWAMPVYRRLILVVVLVIGSHAMTDTFAVIVWRAAGYGGGAVSVLWSVSVAAEVLVFFLAGPWLLARLGPAVCAGLSAGAGVVRWTVMGATTAMPALISAQALHGLTFALLHMVAMRIIVEAVPGRLAATAQTVYGALALGLASAALTSASGYLYAGLGMRAFWVMAGLCVAALPFVGGLRLKA